MHLTSLEYVNKKSNLKYQLNITGSGVAERADVFAKYAMPNPENQKFREVSCVTSSNATRGFFNYANNSPLFP